MSVVFARIQSAPEADGLFFTNDNNVSVEGTYRGSIKIDSFFNVQTAGVIGTDLVEFIGISGALTGEVVTVPADYTAGQAIAFSAPNLSLVFAVGWTAAFFQLIALPNRRVPAFYSFIEGDAKPTALNLTGTQMLPGDDTFETFNRKTLLVERAMRRQVSFDVNFLDKDANVSRLLMEHNRQLVTYAEDYGPATTLYIRQGGSLIPWIGRELSMSAANVSTVFEPVSGLIRKTVSGEPGRCSGFGTNLEDLAAEDRTAIPEKDVLFGGSFQVGGPLTNLLPWWVASPKNVSGPGDYVTWESDGGTLGSRDGSTILHPDDWPTNWDKRIVIHFAAAPGHAIQTHSTRNVADVSGNVGDPLTGQVFLRGSGQYKIQIWTGVATPDTLLHDGGSFTLEADTWKRCWSSDASAVVPAGHTVAKIRCAAVETGAFAEVGPAMLQAGTSPGVPLPSDGTPYSIASEVLDVDYPLPPAGSLLFGYYHGDDGGNSSNKLCRDGANNFVIQHEAIAGAHKVRWRTGSTGPDWLEASIPDWTPGTWKAIAVTWEPEATDLSLLRRRLYVDGVELATDTTTDFTPNYLAPLTIGDETTDGVAHQRYQNFRVDAEALTPLEVLCHYCRMTDPAYVELMAEFAGRLMRITTDTASWDTISYPDRIRAALTLTEHDRFEPALVNRR